MDSYRLIGPTIQVVVEDLGAGGHLRLQHLDVLGLQKCVDGVVGILEIRQLARAGGAIFTRRRW